jgi:hypothetical protein
MVIKRFTLGILAPIPSSRASCLFALTSKSTVSPFSFTGGLGGNGEGANDRYAASPERFVLNFPDLSVITLLESIIRL